MSSNSNFVSVKSWFFWAFFYIAVLKMLKHEFEQQFFFLKSWFSLLSGHSSAEM